MTDDQEEKKRAILNVVAARCFGRDDPGGVLPGLYVGSISAAKNVTVLLDLGITHVINASPVVPCFHRTRLKYKVVEVYDDEDDDISQFFAQSNKFIDKALRKGGVLVHCYAGQSRSPTLVIAYLIARRNVPYEEALHMVKLARPATNPNRGFLRQLQEYAKSLGVPLTSDSHDPPQTLPILTKGLEGSRAFCGGDDPDGSPSEFRIMCCKQISESCLVVEGTPELK
eukprot:jgi/Botrbrau1/18298/Bobra.0179s0028.2